MDELSGLGFKRIELTGNFKYCPDIGSEIQRVKFEKKLDFLFHNYLPFFKDEFVLNLASGDPYIELQSLNLIKHSITLLKEMKVELFTIHPGFRNDLLPEKKDGCFIIKTGPSFSKDNFYKNCNYILNNFVDGSFNIAFENFFPLKIDDPFSFISTPEDIEFFLNYFEKNKNVGILLDLGHINISSKTLNYDKFSFLKKIFKKYGEKIFEIHLSGNNGVNDLHELTLEDSWQVKFIMEYREKLKNTPIVFEWNNCADAHGYEAFEHLRKKLEA